MITATAPGKIILSGEHGVVYGYPALVATVNLYLTTTLTSTPRSDLSDRSDLKLKVHSNIPIGAGMGSSAALAATRAAVILKWLKLTPTKKLINQFTFEAEKVAHGHPSGVDNTAVVYGGWLKFQKPKSITHFDKLNFPQVVLINSGQPKESTARMVDFVAHQSHLPFKPISTITESLIQLLKNYRPSRFNQLNSLLHANELLLEQLGIVSPPTKKIIRHFEQSRGVAKVCGAGGKTSGSGILLCLHKKPLGLIKLAKKLKLKYFYPVSLGVPGISLHTQSIPRHRTPATSAISR